jgi:hypothetical protein
MRLNAGGQDPCLRAEMLPQRVVAAGASHATQEHETNPRRLVSEVGPSETGRCVSGAGEPQPATKPPTVPATTVELGMG